MAIGSYITIFDIVRGKATGLYVNIYMHAVKSIIKIDIDSMTQSR